MELAECHLYGASNFGEAARFFEKLCTCASAPLRSYFTRFLESHFRLQYFSQCCLQQRCTRHDGAAHSLSYV